LALPLHHASSIDFYDMLLLDGKQGFPLSCLLSIPLPSISRTMFGLIRSAVDQRQMLWGEASEHPPHSQKKTHILIAPREEEDDGLLKAHQQRGSLRKELCR